jgi:adenylate cyclase
VVAAVVNAGGHVNKFLGDGAHAVYGAPNDLADHADAAALRRCVDPPPVAELTRPAERWTPPPGV